MFHPVRVAPENRDSLRFLWWPNHDLTAKLEDYQVMVHLFGATLSPSCCCFILRRCANDIMTNASSKTVLALKRSFYVDDMLHFVKSGDDAVKLINELTELLESGRFHSPNFCATNVKYYNACLRVSIHWHKRV